MTRHQAIHVTLIAAAMVVWGFVVPLSIVSAVA